VAYDFDSIPAQPLASLCERRGIVNLAVFGSALRDDFTPESDIDLLVEFAPGATPGLAFFTIQRELSELFGVPVDLNTPAWLSPAIREEAVGRSRTLYAAA